MDGVSNISNLALFTQLQAARGGALEGQVRQLQSRTELTQASGLGGEVGEAADPKGSMAGRPAKEAQLLKATQQFESIFWNFLMERMRAATPKSGFLDSSQEQEIFTSMHDEELSKSLAQTGGLGISRMLFEQLKKTL